MGRKFGKAAAAGVVVIFLLWIVGTQNHLFVPQKAPLPEYVPVDKFLVEITETDQKQTFIKTSSADHANGCQKNIFTNTKAGNSPKEETVLLVALIGNEKSFGYERSFQDFMGVIGSLDYDKSKINLAFFCGTNELFDHVNSFIENLFASQTLVEYGKISVVKAEFLRSEFSSLEHNAKLQRKRRRLIARARNYALISALDMEQYTLFMDADVIKLDHPDMLKRFVASGKDIVVPRIERGDNKDYDKNSWRGQRRVPTPGQLKIMDENQWEKFKFIPKDKTGRMFHLGDHKVAIQNDGSNEALKSPDHIVPLDSVGGAILFAKSLIYKQGIVFPPLYIVGTTWQRNEGYDGIETEGLCYVARTSGYQCWGMPNLVAQHSDHDWR